MKKEPIIFIKHVLENIEAIKSFAKNLSKDHLKEDKLKQYAIIRAIEVIGEAVKNLPPGFRSKYANVPWAKIAGMRDKLMHHYFGINLQTVWKVINEDIPYLKEEMLKIKVDLENKEKV